MLAMLAVVLLTAQTSPQPSPAATLPPEWKKEAPVDSNELLRYSRIEANGTEALIALSRSVGLESAEDESAKVQATFQLIPGAVVNRSIIQACGEQAYRVLVTGRNTPSNAEANNMEATYFRKGGALYTLIYSFLTPAPLSDADAALMMLCPT